MKSVSRSRWLIACAAVFALASASGCVVESDSLVRADMSVEWDIDGFTSPSLCADYDIGGFQVIVDGPERDVSDHDCVLDDWYADVLNLREGIYDISVTAYDSNGVDIMTLDDTIDLIDTGDINVVTMPFTEADFLP